MKKPKRKDSAALKQVRAKVERVDAVLAAKSHEAPHAMPDPFAAMEKAFDKPEAIEALANLRDMFTLAAKAARGDEAALLKVARNNLGPKASDEQVRALAAQLRESLPKR